jgi:hypothetical protein
MSLKGAEARRHAVLRVVAFAPDLPAVSPLFSFRHVVVAALPVPGRPRHLHGALHGACPVAG